MTVKKNGGIWFWRVGRFGGSFYLAKPQPKPRKRYTAEEWLFEGFTLALMATAMISYCYWI